MSDDFEPRVRGWLREAGAADPAVVERLASGTGSLPSRRPRHTWLLSAAAVIVVLAVGVTAAGLSRLAGLSSGSATATPSDDSARGAMGITLLKRPGDPATFAGDARLIACGGSDLTKVESAFEMPHAADYRRYLPKMGISPELDVPDPAFVVVFRYLQPFPLSGAAPVAGQTPGPPRTPRPGYHDACVLVGSDPATWQQNVYTDIDFTGFSPDPQPPGPTAPPTTIRPGDPTSSPTPEPTVAPSPLSGHRVATGPPDYPNDGTCLPVGAECGGVAVHPGYYVRNRSSRAVMVEASGDMSWVVVVHPGETGLIADAWALHTYGSNVAYDSHVALSILDADCHRQTTFDAGREGFAILEIDTAGAGRIILPEQVAAEPLPEVPLEISDACP